MENMVYCSVRIGNSISCYVSGFESSCSKLSLIFSPSPVPIPRRIADLASAFLDMLIDLRVVDCVVFECSDSV